MNSLQFCADTLAAYGASESEILELLTYNQNVFARPLLEHLHQPQSELYLATWEQSTKESATVGAYAILKPHLVQLHFPILAGISETEDYRAATRKGKSTASMKTATGLILRAPEQLQLYIHQTLAGPIPVLVAGNRSDFISLVQALTKRNEPQPIPDSMGACLVGEYNNWHRVRQYQQQWLAKNRNQCCQADWAVEFQQLIQRPELYRDRFILLSRGAYSNVTATELGLDEQQWLELSFKIRLEHECTHYVTRRWFGSMRNNILDELIADYRGIVSAIGDYRADWFLHFVGLEAFPVYRQGGRLENYRGDPFLSDGAFKVLQGLVKTAAENLEKFEQKYRQSLKKAGGRGATAVLGFPQVEQVAWQEAGGKQLAEDSDSSHLPSCATDGAYTKAPNQVRTRQEEMAILIALTTLRMEELASEPGVSLIETAVNYQKKLISNSNEIKTG